MTVVKNKIKKRISFITNVAFFAVFVYISSLFPGFLRQFNSDISIDRTASADVPSDSAGDTDTTYGKNNNNGGDGACDGMNSNDGNNCGPF